MKGPDPGIRFFFVCRGIARFAMTIHESDAVSEIARFAMTIYESDAVSEIARFASFFIARIARFATPVKKHHAAQKRVLIAYS